MKEKEIPKFVKPLPAGSHKNCHVIVVGNTAFVRTTDGMVFIIGRSGRHILSAWSSNDKERAAYAKLTGVTMADMRRAYRAKQIEDRKDDADAEIEIKRLAKQYGFTVRAKP